MLNFLKKPYPFNDDLRHNSKIILFISLGVLAFIMIFQPLEISSFSTREIIYLFAGLVASTFIILTLNLIILPSLFPKMFDTNIWNIKREIIWNVWSMMTISIIYYLFYSRMFGIIILDIIDIGKIIILSSIPVAALIVINHNRLLRDHLSTARMMNKKLTENDILKEKLINLESEYKHDNLIIKSGSLILIRAADNYIEVFYESDGAVKSQMIRSSLKNVEEILSEFDFILKCHRSFIINTYKIIEVQGNSLGYKLLFNGIDFPALVSQKYIDVFKEKFNRIN